MQNVPQGTQAKESKAAARAAAAASAEPADTLKPFEEAYDEYFRQLQEAWSYEEACDRIDKAQHDYEDSVKEISASPDPVRHVEAYAQLMRNVQEAWLPKESRNKFEKAYTTYLEVTAKAWANADINNLNAAQLSAIGQSMMIVAQNAALSR